MTLLIPAPPTAPIVPGQVRYLIELVEGSTYTGRSVELPNLTSLAGVEAPSINVTYTAGGVVREISAPRIPGGGLLQAHGIRQRTWTCAGLSGKKHRLGNDREGNTLYASGADLWTELRGFFDVYAAKLAIWQDQNWYLPPPKRNPAPSLVLRLLAEGEEYLVETSGVASTRTVDTYPMWQYSIGLQSYAPAPEPELTGISAIFGTIAGIANTATQFIDEMSAWVAYSTAVVNGANSTVSQFLAPIAAVGRLAGEVSALALAGRAALGLPRRLVEATFQAANQGVNALADLGDFFTGGAIDNETDAFRRDAANRMNAARTQALQVLGTAGLALQSLPGDGQTVGIQGAEVIGATANVITVTVSDGDTLDAIAQRAGTTVAALISLNDMPDAYTLANGAPLGAGATLIAPQAAGLPALSPTNLFGRDLTLSPVPTLAQPVFDLVLVGGEPNDWATVTGTQNFYQALRLRGLTAQGEFGLWPSYGLNLRLGQRDTQTTTGALAADTVRQFRQDPRVARVGPIDVVRDGDKWRLDVPVYAKTGGGAIVPVAVT